MKQSKRMANHLSKHLKVQKITEAYLWVNSQMKSTVQMKTQV